MYPSSSDSPDKKLIKSFLRKYADGRYKDSAVEFVPESGRYLVLVPYSVAPFSRKASVILSNNLRKKLGLNADVDRCSDFSHGPAYKALALALENLLDRNFVDVAMLISHSEAIDVVVYVGSEDLIENGATNRDLTRKIASFLRAYDLELGRVYITELVQGPPTPSQILWCVYRAAPANIGGIIGQLSEQGLSVPSENWLKRTLDGLVRLKAVIWQKPGCYALTSFGISALPNRRGRNSPDVERALELGLRKW